MIEITHRDTGAVIFTSATATHTAVGLTEAVTAGANLAGAFLYGAYLRRAFLGFADLRKADLRKANLKETDLGSANLREADLGDADLRRANFAYADLTGANLAGAKFGGADFVRANFSGAKFGVNHTCNGKLMQIVNVAEWGAITAYITDKGELRVICGCLHMSFDEIEAHWKDREGRRGARVALEMIRVWGTNR